jgi:hypothetical protein
MLYTGRPIVSLSMKIKDVAHGQREIMKRAERTPHLSTLFTFV